MRRSIIRAAGIVFSVLAIISLILPIYGTNITEGEGWLVDLRGYDVPEFSLWGIFVILMPLVSIGVICSKLSEKAKLILTILSGILGIFGAYLANASAREWIYSVADGFVYTYGGLWFYGILFVCSSVLFCIFCNMNGSSAKSITVSPVDIYEEEFLLPDGGYTFSMLKKDREISEFSGNISFATSDGYFAAVGQFQDCRSVEVLRGDENAGFRMRTMPSGIYGAFYEGMGNIGSVRFKIKAFSEIRSGSAELWCCGEKKAVELKVQDFMSIKCTLCDECENTDELRGAVIIQDGRIAAAVSGIGEGKNVFTCISAEQAAADLGRLIYEQRVLEAVNAEEKG